MDELSDSEQDDSIDPDFVLPRPTPGPSEPVQKKKQVITPELVEVLDRCNTTDNSAVYISAAITKSLGVDINNVTLSRSSIRRNRIKCREEIAHQIKTDFKNDDKLTVHWDGKLLQDICSSKKSERLAVIVCGDGIEQLLGVPKLRNGTGKSIAEAVMSCLREWNIIESICAMSFDTTAANTGIRNGACVLLEEAMNKKVLGIACRHHIFEIVLESVFSLSFGASTGPEITIFSKFKSYWAEIDQKKNKKYTSPHSSNLHNRVHRG